MNVNWDSNDDDDVDDEDQLALEPVPDEEKDKLTTDPIPSEADTLDEGDK